MCHSLNYFREGMHACPYFPPLTLSESTAECIKRKKRHTQKAIEKAKALNPPMGGDGGL